MARYNSVPPPEQAGQPGATQAPPTQPIDVGIWAATAVSGLSISPSTQGTGVQLTIPLDSTRELDAARDARASAYKARKEPLKRDSQRKRESLLKGKDGSRRRQRWENGE